MEERDEEVKFSVPFASKCIVEKYQKAFSSSKQTKINDFLTLSKNQELRPVSFLCIVHHELKIHAMQHFVGQFAKQNFGAKIEMGRKPNFHFFWSISRSKTTNLFSLVFNLTDLLISLIQGLLDNCLLH